MRITTIVTNTGVLLTAMALLAPNATAGSPAGYPPSLAENVRGTAEVALVRLPGIDITKVEEEDLKREQEGMAPRFAVPMDVRIAPTATTGTWETLSDGRLLWRHRISSPEALSLNFGFTRFHLPPTAELWFYTTGYDQIVGPFTENDNDAHRQLWTPVLLAEEVVLELAISPEFLPYLEMELTRVGHGYTGFGYPRTNDFTLSPNPATAGQLVTFDAINVVGTGPFEYAWDFNGDTVTDCTTDPCTHTYSAYFNGNVVLTVTDVGESCAGSLSKAMVVNAPSVEYVSTGIPFELCGDADSIIEPGEEWAVPVTVTNVGNMAGANVTATVSVFGAPAEVVMTADVLDFGSVAAGADATTDFSFGIDPTFGPCGAGIQFDLGAMTWTGGANPGSDDIFTAATGGGTGTQVALGDDFEDVGTWHGLGDPAVITDQWVVTTGPGSHTAGEWVRAASGAQGQPSGSTGFFAVADSDDAGSGSTTSTILWSPMVDLSGILSGSITVDFNAFYNSIGDNESADVDVWDGSAWQNVTHWTNSDVDAHQSIDVSAFALGNPDFRVRFSYQDASWDWWFAIDNFEVIVPITPVCDNGVSCGFGEEIFSDGFESSTTDRWSHTQP